MVEVVVLQGLLVLDTVLTKPLSLGAAISAFRCSFIYAFLKLSITSLTIFKHTEQDFDKLTLRS